MYAVVGTDGVVYGPVPVATLYEWIAQGRIVPGTTLIDWQGRQVPASMAPELQGAFPVQTHAYPSTYPSAGMAPGYGFATKSKRTAMGYAFFLGFLGAHRFYLGHRRSGFGMLALNAATLFYVQDLTMMIVLGVAATVWLIADMAMIASGALKPADGSPLG